MVKFIEYTGEYPNLCSGVLTLEIDGEKAVFGYDQQHQKFWSSGGSVWFDDDWNDYTAIGEWQIDVDELPEQYKKYAKEIAEVFNENVEYGCCGGCI